MPSKQPVSNVAYHTVGADGKVYGIIREGLSYYIKTTEPGKEKLAESYEYIGGFMNKKNNEYKSFNQATRHLELNLMSLNESVGKHEDVSVVDFKKNEKALETLTEEARKELNRIKMIMENSATIGKNNTGDTESKDRATEPAAQGAPFDEKASFSEEGAKSTQGDASKANDYSNVPDPEKQMTSDKAPGKGQSDDGCKKADCDLDGECVATKKPAGGKVTHVNESMDLVGTEDGADMMGDDLGMEGDMAADDLDAGLDMTDDLGMEDDTLDMEDDLGMDDFGAEDDLEECGDLDALLEEFDSKVSETEKALTGPTSDSPEKSIAMADSEIDEDVEPAKEENLKSFNRGGNMAPISWEHMNESQKRKVARIVEGVCRNLLAEAKKPVMKPKKVVKESTMSKIQRIVNEEVNRLNVWGDHPGYRKKPMTLPANKEVMRGTADRDINDKSAKGEQPFGSKIGDGKPFDQVVTDVVNDALANLRESYNRKKSMRAKRS